MLLAATYAVAPVGSLPPSMRCEMGVATYRVTTRATSRAPSPDIASLASAFAAASVMSKRIFRVANRAAVVCNAFAYAGKGKQQMAIAMVFAQETADAAPA